MERKKSHNAINLDRMDPLVDWVVHNEEPMCTKGEIEEFEREATKSAATAIGMELKDIPKDHVKDKDLPLPHLL